MKELFLALALIAATAAPAMAQNFANELPDLPVAGPRIFD
jgi:hypothetical protein